MLRDFVQSNREELISRTRAKLSARPSPSASTAGVEHGVSRFLTQLPDTLGLATRAGPFSAPDICADAAEHGRELLAEGCSISQGVHDYADAGEAIAELASERGATITPEELCSLTRCVDTAIAQAVTEYGRLKEEASSQRELDRRRQLAHDLRNLVQTALLSLRVLEAVKSDARGNSARLLGRSLGKIRELADGILSGGKRIPGPASSPREDPARALGP